ncbi:MAG: O-antigen ligase family protein [Lachnospiraceae bacterium]|nr:O-antigen ligase family protein [Lachnospiraceae bacterium]
MSRSGKAKAAAAAAQRSPISKKLLKEITAVYVFFMFAIYPLYYENKYYNMGEAKWHFFKWVTLVAMILLGIVFIWYQVQLYSEKKIAAYWDLKKTSITDRFVLAYGLLAILSFLFSPYKDYTLIGYDGWYMGLIAQLAFCLLYYFASRFWRWDEICIIIYLSVSTIVFLLCILNRFYNRDFSITAITDPLQMYLDLDESYIINFISTLGQATWFSSYMVLVYPIGVFAFWYYDKKVVRILSGLYTLVCCMTMITQNSDSAFAAYFVILVGLFCFSFRENKYMKRFLEICILLFAGWKLVGILQTIFAKCAVELSNTMMGFSKGKATWLLLIISAAVYAGFCLLDKNEKIDIRKLKIIRILVLALIGAGVAAIVVYVTLNSTGALAGTPYESDNNYLRFDTYWGNNRGSSWMVTVKSFVQCDLIRKLFGAGPDGFYNLVYTYCAPELIEKWGENTVLTCAHNEWMTAVINVGVFGAIAYTGIFIAAIVRFTKKSVERPEVITAVLSILGYMSHNFFCYQQIICTPSIFLIIGIGECLCRYGLRPIWEEDGYLNV